MQSLRKDHPDNLGISMKSSAQGKQYAKHWQTLRCTSWKIHLLCVCCRRKLGGVGLFRFPSVIMTRIDKFETNFKSELELCTQFLSAGETWTCSAQNGLAEPRDKFCWCLPEWNGRFSSG